MKAGLLCAAGLVAMTAAQPHRQLQQRHHHHHQHAVKRQEVVEEFVTVIDIVTQTAPDVVVFVDSNGNPMLTSCYDQLLAASTPASTSTSPASDATRTLSNSINVAPPVQPASSTPPPSPSPSTPPPAGTSASPSAPAAFSSSSPTSPGHSFSSSGVGTPFEGYALSYNPYAGDGSCKSQDQVNNDFDVFSGYDMIRIYGTDCNQVSTVLSAVRAKGLKLFAGIYDIDEASTEAQLIINAANGNWEDIHTVAVGNEGVNDGTYSVDAVVEAVDQVRNQLRASGYNGNVVTVDTFVAIIANPQLCQASDYAAANCHAFFDDTVTAQEAGRYVLAQAQAVSEACGGKATMITESGWPSQGETNGAAVPSQDNQQAAISSLRNTFSGNIVLFSAFNDYWKTNGPGTFGAEQYWGIYGNAPSGG